MFDKDECARLLGRAVAAMESIALSLERMTSGTPVTQQSIDARRRASDWREHSAAYRWNPATHDYDPVRDRGRN